MSSQNKSACVRVDGHVHVYSCHDEERAVSMAADHLIGSAPESGVAALFLSEISGCDWFASLNNRRIGRWVVQATGESVSRWLVDEMDRRVLVIAGCQINTAEQIEVMAIGSTRRFPDGQPLLKTMNQVASNALLLGLPWGLGKWWGRRGRLLAQAIEAFEGPPGVLVDNAGRPPLVGMGACLVAGRVAGWGVIAGTDPFPLPGSEKRIGLYHTALKIDLRASDPAFALCQAISRVGPDQRLGRRIGLFGAAREQWGLRKKKHLS